MQNSQKTLEQKLLDQNLLTPDKAQAFRRLRERRSGASYKLLVEQGLVQPEHWNYFLCSQLQMPFLPKIEKVFVDPVALALIPNDFAHKHHVIPLFKVNDSVSLALTDPLDIWLIEDLRLRTGCDVLPVVCPENEILAALDQFYPLEQEAIGNVLVEMAEQFQDDIEVIEDERLEETEMAGREAPIIKLVNLMISEAMRARASDIHIEPEEKTLRVRYRVDGFLRDALAPAKRLQPSISSRIKIMANMDIAEKRKPQDGRIKLRIRNRDVDVRVSTLPGVHGEKIVMRILDPTILSAPLEDLGFTRDLYEKFIRTVSSPYGIVLVTGPTGSGKSTTLYAALSRINTQEKNIITIEDPVEYLIRGLNQVQVNPRAGVTFASALRTVFRQDPDVVMVGEMRDEETAEIAIRASLTGHLVLSTLHTNDAPGAVTRLLDMGIPPYLVASSIIGVLAQRLVRTICQNCKQPYVPTPTLLREIGLGEGSGNDTFFKGKGCDQCEHTGYRGRVAILEFFVVSEELRKLIYARQPTAILRSQAKNDGMRTLWEDGLDKAMRGITGIEEVQRVATRDIF